MGDVTGPVRDRGTEDVLDHRGPILIVMDPFEVTMRDIASTPILVLSMRLLAVILTIVIMQITVLVVGVKAAAVMGATFHMDEVLLVLVRKSTYLLNLNATIVLRRIDV